MSSTLLLNCILMALLFATIGAITVSIDRADIKVPSTRSSMIANGWRPLTNSYEETIGTNVSPSSHLEKNVQVHPVLSKFQEHMATSEKLKPPRKGKPPVHEYSPPSILGSFTVFGHAAAKARGSETKPPGKHVASETREYTFLVPPPKDAYRFEVNQHRKPILRDNSNYLRQPPQYIAAQQPDPVRAATYFIKGYASTAIPVTHPANHPSNRPYVPPYAMPQALHPLQPPRHEAKPFESLKVAGNAKPYYQPPGADIPGDFGKQKIGGERNAYDGARYQAQSHSAQQILSPASSGNFYSQVNHPPASHFKSTYERDPAFLVHESHEISYATPPGTYNAYNNFRPSLPYETLLPLAVYASSSTPPPTTAITRNTVKFNDGTAAVDDYKRTDQSAHRKKQETSGGQTEAPTSRTTSTYYVSEHLDLTSPSTWSAPKSKYTSDINEVLPRENPPTKFNAGEALRATHERRPHDPYRPVEIYQVPTTVPDYETPESISLKHFNEQQFLLQQQLLQRDRDRLVEQERQQKLEIERQQREELKKRQEELNQLLRREKEEEEAARLAAESAKNQSQEIVKISEMPYTIQLAQYEPQVTTDVNILVSQPGIYNVEQLRIQPQVPQIPENQVNQNYQYQQHFQNEYQGQQIEYREPPQPETRPYRPQKPPRDPQRRRKPTTIAYELPSPTEPPSQQPPETSVPFYAEDVPIQTTVVPETQTLPTVTTQRPRTRRPISTHRRRKPSTTTQEPIVAVADEDFLKYNRDEGSPQQPNHYDSSRRRRVKPTQSTYAEDTATEKRVNIRKRPGHRNRVNHGEPFDAEIVTENAHVSLNSYGNVADVTSVAPNYNDAENSQFATGQPAEIPYETAGQEGERYVTGQPVNQYYDYTSQRNEERREDTTAPIRVLTEYYGTEVNRDQIDDYNVRQQNAANIVTGIPAEDIYVRTTDDRYYDRVTTAAPTTTTMATTTSTTAPESTTQTVSSTLRSHKIRPLRYGNATRPRFSIKDYKSRLDYKSRVSQVSTTENAVAVDAVVSTRSPYVKQRTASAKTQQQAQPGAAEPARETNGRYKYVSRVNYRTTTTPAGQERFSDESAATTTEKSNRFVPKRRPISGNVYRSRIASTTGSPTRSQVHGDATSVRQSSARPENVYSSSIRRRPAMKSRLQQKEAAAVATDKSRREQSISKEMTAEESSFYSAMTTTASTNRLVGNEIVSEKSEAASLDDQSHAKIGVQESKNEGDHVEISVMPRDQETKEPTIETIDGERQEATEESRVEKPTDEVPATVDSRDDALEPSKEPETTETTTKFDVPADEEELFAKASQSVADLTSSASALYDKPGMFKAVSPESRLVVPSAHFKITTDEPTLPIEAFFQELSKKN